MANKGVTGKILQTNELRVAWGEPREEGAGNGAREGRQKSERPTAEGAWVFFLFLLSV
jgi:hypothetical protein